MNNFNIIFVNLKKYCAENDAPVIELKEIEEQLAVNTKKYKLRHYLEALGNLGFIQFSKQNNTIALTDKGRRAENLFTIDP